MRKLKYNIPIGTEFRLPKMSRQFPDYALCTWRVCKREKNRWEEVEYICEKANDPTCKLTISEMCLAFLLGQEVPAQTNVAYEGTEYQPTYQDPWRNYAEEDNNDGGHPFWYFSGNIYKSAIHCTMNTAKWCYYTLPWD